MKIHLAKDLEHRCISHQPGNTWAEKLSYFDAFVRSLNYWTVLSAYADEWVEVSTKFLFTQSFNAMLDTNGIYHVDQYMVDDVDLSPEFNTIDEWIEAVKKRYDVDWPGTDVPREMMFWRDRLKKRYH